MTARPSPQRDWTVLIISSGLAVTITAAGTYLTDRVKAAGEAGVRRCAIAATFLSDETPSPYMSERDRQVVTHAASVTLARCLKER